VHESLGVPPQRVLDGVDHVAKQRVPRSAEEVGVELNSQT
jgi:hypothetical protein